MNEEGMISASEFCIQHKIDLSFIHSLQEYGLIEILTVDEQVFLPAAQLERVEMFVRFHYHLEINLQGIETITHLLDRIKHMQEQITQLTNKLKRFEG